MDNITTIDQDALGFDADSDRNFDRNFDHNFDLDLALSAACDAFRDDMAVTQARDHILNILFLNLALHGQEISEAALA